MARGKKKEQSLTLGEKLDQAFVPVEEQPYLLPQNWCWVRMKSIADIYNGNSISDQVKEVKYRGQSKGLRFIATKDIDFHNTVEYETNIRISDYENFKVAPTHTSLLCIEGGSAGRKVGFIEEDVCFGNKLCAFVANGISSRFIFYFLQSNCFVNQFNEKKNGLIGGVSLKKIAEIAFALPPLSEQQRIVDRVERLFAKLDEARERVQDVVDNYEPRKLAILNSAFSGEFTSEWRNSHTPSLVVAADACRQVAQQWAKKEQRLLAAEQEKICFESKENGHMWMVCTIGAVARISNGSTPSRAVDAYWNGDIPWVSSGEVKNNIIYETAEKITQAGFENTSVKLLPVGTVLIAMIGEGKTRGQSAILQIPATTNQNVAAIIIDSHHIDSKYLWYWLQMNYAKNREIGGGSGPQALNCQKVRELDFKLPSIVEQVEIVRILDSLLAKEQQAKEAAEAVLEKIDLLKKSILARAFRGDLGTNDPTEESAVELLREIQKGDI